MVVKKIFKIDGMHCTSCSMMIDGDLEEVEGILSSSTNYAKQITLVEYDDLKINEHQVVSIIQNTGYGASIN